MSVLQFRGGGSLDGLAWQSPFRPSQVVTTVRDGGRSIYVLDDLAAVYRFAGLNEEGSVMGRLMRAFSETAKAEREAIEAASAPQGCGSCGRTFANAAAHMVHTDRGVCLPDGAHGQLVNVDGVWDSAWRHPELQR